MSMLEQQKRDNKDPVEALDTRDADLRRVEDEEKKAKEKEQQKAEEAKAGEKEKETGDKTSTVDADKQHIKVENEIINELMREVQVGIANLNLKKDPAEKLDEQPKAEQKTEEKATTDLAQAINKLSEAISKEPQLNPTQAHHIMTLQQQIQTASRASISANEDPRFKEATAELLEQTLIKMNQGKASLPKADQEQIRNAEPDLTLQAVKIDEYQKGLILLGEKKVVFDASETKDLKLKTEIEQQQQIVDKLKVELLEKKVPADRLEVLEKNVENLTSRLELRTDLKSLYKAQYELAMAQASTGDLTNQVYVTERTAELKAAEAKIAEKFPGKVYNELVVQTRDLAGIEAGKSGKLVHEIVGNLYESDWKVNGDIAKKIVSLDPHAKSALASLVGSEGHAGVAKGIIETLDYSKYSGKIANENIIDASLPYQSINPDVFVRKNQVDITKMKVEQAVHSDNPVVELHRVLQSSNPETIRAVQSDLLSTVAQLTDTSRMEGIPAKRQEALNAAVLLEQRMMTDLIKGNGLKQGDLAALQDQVITEHGKNLVRQGEISIIRTPAIPQSGYEDSNAKMIECKEGTVAAAAASRERLKGLQEIGVTIPTEKVLEQIESQCITRGIKEAATNAQELIAKKAAVIQNQTFTYDGGIDQIHEEFGNKGFAKVTDPETSAAEVRRLSKHFQKYEMEGWDSKISERDKRFVAYMGTLAYKKEGLEEIQQNVNAGIDEALRSQKVDLKMLADVKDPNATLTTDQAIAAFGTNAKKEIEVKVEETRKFAGQAEEIYNQLHTAISGGVFGGLGTKDDVLEKAMLRLEDTPTESKAVLRSEVNRLVKERESESLLYYVIDDLSGKGEIFDAASRLTGDRTGYIAKQIATEGARATEFIIECKKNAELKAKVDEAMAVKDSTLHAVVSAHVDLKNTAARNGSYGTQSTGIPRSPATAVVLLSTPTTVEDAVSQYSSPEQKRAATAIIANDLDKDTGKLKIKEVDKADGKEKEIQIDPAAFDIALRVKRTIGFNNDEALLKEILEGYLITGGKDKLWEIDPVKLAELEKAFAMVVPGVNCREFLHKQMTSVFGDTNNDSRAVDAIFDKNEAKYFANRNIELADPAGTKDAEIKKLTATYRPPELEKLLAEPDSPEKNEKLRDFQEKILVFHKDMLEQYPQYEKELVKALQAGYSGSITENIDQTIAAVTMIEAAKRMPTYADTESKDHNPALVKYFPDVVDVFAATLGKSLGTEEKPCIDIFRKYTNSEMHGENSFRSVFESMVHKTLDKVISDETGLENKGWSGDTIYHSLHTYSQGRPETYAQAMEFVDGMKQIESTILVSNFGWFTSTYEKQKLDASQANYEAALLELKAKAKGDDVLLEKLFKDTENQKKLQEITKVLDRDMDAYREKIKENTNDVVEVVEVAGMVAIAVIPGAGAVVWGMHMNTMIMSAGLAMVRPAASSISGMGSENTFVSTVQGAGGFLAVPVAIGGAKALAKGSGWLAHAAETTGDFLGKPMRMVEQKIIPTKVAVAAMREGAVVGNGGVQLVEGASDRVIKGMVAEFKKAAGGTDALVTAAQDLGKIAHATAENIDDVLVQLAKKPGAFNDVLESAHAELTAVLGKAENAIVTTTARGTGAARQVVNTTVTTAEGAVNVPRIRMLLQDEAEAFVRSEAGFFRNVAHSIVTDGYKGFKVGALVSGTMTALDPRVYEDLQTAGGQILNSAWHGGLMAGGLSAGVGGIGTSFKQGVKKLFDNSKSITPDQITKANSDPRSAEVLAKKAELYGGEANLKAADYKAAMDARNIKPGTESRWGGLKRSIEDLAVRDLAQVVDALPANASPRAKEVFAKAKAVQKAQLGDDSFGGASSQALREGVFSKARDAKFHAQDRVLTVEQQQAALRIVESIGETGSFSKLDYRQFTGNVQRYTTARVLSIENVSKLMVEEFHNSQILKTTDGTVTYDPAHFANQNVPFQVAEYLGYQLGNKVIQAGQKIQSGYENFSQTSVGQAIEAPFKAVASAGDWVSTNIGGVKSMGTKAMTLVTAAHLTFAPMKAQSHTGFEPLSSKPTTSHVENAPAKPAEPLKSIWDADVSVEQSGSNFQKKVVHDADAAVKKINDDKANVDAKKKDSVKSIYDAIKDADQRSPYFKPGASDEMHEQDLIRNQIKNQDRIKEEEQANKRKEEKGKKKKEDEDFGYSDESVASKERKREDSIKPKTAAEISKEQEEELQKLNLEIAQAVFLRWRRSGFTMALEPIHDSEGKVIGHEWREKLAVWTC